MGEHDLSNAHVGHLYTRLYGVSSIIQLLGFVHGLFAGQGEFRGWKMEDSQKNVVSFY
jgi:hypothetical protein